MRGARLWGERERRAREGAARGEMMGWRGEKVREERGVDEEMRATGGAGDEDEVMVRWEIGC